jgi:hypothetical protein
VLTAYMKRPIDHSSWKAFRRAKYWSRTAMAKTKLTIQVTRGTYDIDLS